MPKKVLIVTKDRMEFNLYHPVALGLEKAGCEVVVVAEGLSMEMWIKSGRQIYGGLPETSSLDPNTLMRNDIAAHVAIVAIRPDVILTGLASPINLADMFASGAKEFDILLGFVEDLWGVHKRIKTCGFHGRIKTVPDFICTIDDYGRKTIEDNPDFDGNQPEVYVTGSPADDALLEVKPDKLTDEIVDESGAERVILIAGQDESTTPMVSGLVKVLESMNDCIIIPRFHPKWMSDPTKASFRDAWVNELYKAERQNRVLWTPPSIPITSLMLSATEVVSIYSNALREAAILGRLAVSWNSDVGRSMMRASLGTETFPLVTLGAVTEVIGAFDYLNQVPSPFGLGYINRVKSAKDKVKADGKSTGRVVSAILTQLI